MSENLNNSLGPHLSKDLETEGFDLQAGEIWIYPTNYPVREYQYNITLKALLKNTLVSLPTGLGKTFIAAVVMFNYFRWYPHGKVIFMAPTRPLVKQQIDACYDIMAIPKECTVEITGVKMSNSREEIWNKKRVFFITPQILQNDLDKFKSLGPKIKCVVFDEAHKAKGNHSYCEVIKKLTSTNKFFRVLALSATPGGSVNDVLEVVQNLLISHLEFRTEESLDVSPYVFQRNLTTVVVPLEDKLQEFKDKYMKILEFNTRTLMKYNVVQGNCATLTKGKIFMLMKNYQQQNRGTSPNYAEIMKSLNICITLYHAAELLVRHGLRSFLTFFDEHIDKPLLRNNMEIRDILADIREYLGPPPQIQQLPDGEYPEISKDIKFGHPKFYKLRDILVEHLKDAGDSSRVMVFFEYRESVMEAYALLIQSRPILKPRVFVGQKQGVTQKLQINVVKAFREGRCNVLLSTCIGEEGLDVGEVDLIVCFDISNKSPIRMVQRMGRTGRKKNGNVVVLVTEGKEQQTLKDCLIYKNNVAFHVMGSKLLANGLNKECPKLIPDGLVPKCEKIYITIEKPAPKNDGNIKNMFRTLSSKSSELSFSPDLQIEEIQETIPEKELLLFKDNPFDDDTPLSNVFSKKIEKQRSLHEIHMVEHSDNCELLVNLLQLAESRRFNIPMTQISAPEQSKHLKQTDIRNMFFKPTPAIFPESTPPIKSEDKNVVESELFAKLSNFLSLQSKDNKRCRLCPSQSNCERSTDNTNNTNKRTKHQLVWLELDASLYSNIASSDLKLFEKSLNASDNSSSSFDETMDFKIPETPKTQKVLGLEDLIDDSILADFSSTTCHFEAPKSLDGLLVKYNTSLTNEEFANKNPTVKRCSDTRPNIPDLNAEQPRYKETSICSKNFDDKDALNRVMIESRQNEEKLQDVVEKSGLERHTVPNAPSGVAKNDPKQYSPEEISVILNFFNLDSLEELLGDAIVDSQRTLTYSPDIFDVSEEKSPTHDDDVVVVVESDNSNSPILGSFVTSKNHSRFQSLTQTFKESSNSIIVEDRVGSSSRNVSVTFDDLFDFSFFDAPPPPPPVNKEPTVVSPSKQPSNEQFREEKFPISPTLTGRNREKLKSRTSAKRSIDFLENTEEIMIENDSGVSLKRKNSAIENNSFEDFDEPKSLDFLDFAGLSKNISDFRHPASRKSKDSNERAKLDEQKSKTVDLREISTAKMRSITQKDYKSSTCPSQASITQLISLINKPTQNKSVQKENLDRNLSDLDDDFDFSYDFKKTLKSKNSANGTDKSANPPLKTTKLNAGARDATKLNESTSFKSPDSSTNSENSSSSKNTRPKTKCRRTDAGGRALGKYLNSSLNASLSDEEFETSPSPKRSKHSHGKTFETDDPVFAVPKPTKKMKNGRAAINRDVYSGSNRPANMKQLVNEFIDEEAELSGGSSYVSDDEEEFENQDCYDESFVADETQNVDTQMHAVYLKSINSPRLPNRFKIPQRLQNYSNVFSQAVEEEEDSLDDSFVVEDEMVEERDELSQLEILEKQLENEQRTGKMPRGVNKLNKRKRIIVASDSD